jgi:hypothetical protein
MQNSLSCIMGAQESIMNDIDRRKRRYFTDYDAGNIIAIF